MEIYLFEVAGRATEILLSPYVLVIAALVGLALATGTAGRIAIRIEDSVRGVATIRQIDDN